MLNDDSRNKIQDIISGTPIHWKKDNCTATRYYLCRSFSPGTTVKKEQAAAIEIFMTENGLP